MTRECYEPTRECTTSRVGNGGRQQGVAMRPERLYFYLQATSVAASSVRTLGVAWKLPPGTGGNAGHDWFVTTKNWNMIRQKKLKKK